MALTQIKAAGLTADLIDETKLADDSIDSEHYNDASIDHQHLANDCIDGDNLVDNAVDSEHYTDGSIDEVHIADNAVSLAKMAGGTDGQIITYDANGDPLAVGPGTDGQVLTSTGAGSPPAFETISTSDTLSNRNVLDNGCFAVRQKGDVTWNTVSSNTKQIPDRWQGWTNVSGFNIAVTAGTPPIDKGFGTCVKLNNNAAVTPGTNDLIQWQTTLEGQDCQKFKFGTSEAEDLTLSFWCKASATAAGQYGIQLMYTDVGSSGHQCNQKFTAATSWTKHTITFPGTGTAATAGEGILNSNAAGLYVYICLGAGSGKLSGSGTNTWASGGSHVWPTGQHNFLGDTDNELEFTGFQLETGSTATEYEHKSYSEELQRCLRYFWMITGDQYDKPGISTFANNASTCRAQVKFPVPMRAAPTFTGSSTEMFHDSSNDSDAFNISSFVLSAGNITTEACPSGCTIEVSTGTMDAGAAGDLEFKEDGGFMQFIAEL